MMDIILYVLLFFTVEIIILAFMVREPLKQIAENITDVAYKLERIEDEFERTRYKIDQLDSTLRNISYNLDHMKYDMKLILGVTDKKEGEENAKG